MISLSLDDGVNCCSIYFDEKGQGYTTRATQSHWVEYADKNRSEAPSENFAGFTNGNDAQFFLGGKAYFEALLSAFKQAKKSIYIAGWQVNWDAQLADGVRLVDALLDVAKSVPGIKIYIMPWKNRSPIETYARATERVFAAMNHHLGKRVFFVQLASHNDSTALFFSHHQKCVIIDEEIAFVGGIDLAYGRYDDHFGLIASADNRKGLNQYNPCVPQMLTGTAEAYDPMREHITLMTSNDDEKPYHEQQNIKQCNEKAVQRMP
ncbi:MAG: hypothetical protein LBN41_03665 [Enterobacteriaceae bacterium]|jgi:phospholipase D1/2|nr:hypothetical protein [Enterobacteriaceae bacterium]